MTATTRDFTATTFVVEERRTLLLWHNKIHAWLPPGGHIETNELPEQAARREVLEETGLQIEFIAPIDMEDKLGDVSVLRRPVCILLEHIEPDHQHIDFIYYGRVTGGRLVIDERAASDCRWCNLDDLEDPEIPVDIRSLGRNAIAAAERLPPSK